MKESKKSQEKSISQSDSKPVDQQLNPALFSKEEMWQYPTEDPFLSCEGINITNNLDDLFIENYSEDTAAIQVAPSKPAELIFPTNPPSSNSLKIQLPIDSSYEKKRKRKGNNADQHNSAAKKKTRLFCK